MVTTFGFSCWRVQVGLDEDSGLEFRDRFLALDEAVALTAERCFCPSRRRCRPGAGWPVYSEEVAFAELH